MAVLAVASVFSLSQVALVPASARERWGGWAELGGYAGGDDASRGEAAVFVPLAQNDRGLFFADVRGKLFEDTAWEGNAAVGYRHMHASGWNFGGWLGADRRDTENDNAFWAVSGGLEALSETFDARLNGYWAATDPKLSPGTARVEIRGNQVIMEGAEEVPLSGIDGEVGVRVPLERMGLDGARHALRVYGGGFYFDADEARRAVSGPKARLEWRVHDVLAALPGTRLALETEWRSDAVRGGHLEAGLRFAVPFATFAGGAAPAADAPVQWRRMTDGLERDTDIVTGRSGQEPVEDGLTGVDLDRVAYADASTGITGPAAAAGANSLIVADGAAGPIDGPQALQARQTLVGGGGSIEVRGRTSGGVAVLTAPGSRPTLSNGLNAANLTLADRTHVSGVRMTGDVINPFNDAVVFGSSQFVVLEDIDIQTIGGAGVFGVDGNTVTVRDLTVTDAPWGPALALNNGNSVAISDSRFETVLIGVFANDDNRITVTDTTFADTCGEGVLIDDDNTLALSGVTMQAICSDAIGFDNRNVISVTGSTFTNIGFDVFFGSDDNVITARDTTVSGAGEDLIDVVDGNTVTLDNVQAAGLAERGIWVEDGNTVTVIGGSISSAWEGIDADDGNAVTLLNTTLVSVGGEEAVDLSDNNTFVMTGSTVRAFGNRVLEFTSGNAVTVNTSVLGGTPSDTVAFDGTGNTLAGAGNVDESAPTGVFCANAGAQTGSLAFTSGATCP